MGLLEQLRRLFMSLLQLIQLLLNPVFLIPTIIIIVILIKKNKEYKSGAYYQVTKCPYLAVRRDTGRYGEYLTYKCLKNFEANGARFLFNIYIPKSNGETSEIDVLMISSKGIFVFESKNYSGWIFGSESQKNWCQTLPAGRGKSHKEHFYNPILQNRTHIQHLKSFLGDQIPMRSVIVFSDRCTLKSVQVKSNDISVINRYNVAPVVSTICDQVLVDQLSENDIADIYEKLYPLTQVDEKVRAQHITNIRNNLNSRFAKKTLSVDESSVVMVPSAEANESIESTQADADSMDPEIAEEYIQPSDIASAESKPNETAPIEQQVLKCPRCNSNLILRTAARGANTGKQFYGCSNYPKCKYIQNITNKTV